MGRNRFPINAAAVNSLNPNGVAFVFPATPIVSYSKRALDHEAMIALEGQTANLRTLSPIGSFFCVLAEKNLRFQDGATPLSHQKKKGYISWVALARAGFTRDIRRGDVVSTADNVWHVDEAFLQKAGGVALRWVLIMSESGTP